MNRFRFNTHRFNAIGVAIVVSPFPLSVTLEILQVYGIQVSEIKEHSIVITDSQNYYITIIENDLL